MGSAARFMATMAVAFVMVPALYANNAAKSKAKAKKDGSATSIGAPPVTVKAKPDTPKTIPPRYSTIWQSRSSAYGQPAGAARQRDASDEATPKIEWFLGYSFWRAMPTSFGNRMGYLHGGSTSIAYNFNRYVGLVADFGGYDNSRLTLFSPAASRTVDASGSAYTYLFGPRFSYRKYEKFTPFVQALFGESHASPVTISGCTGDPRCTPLGSDNVFATMLGTGFDVKISHHVALRLFEGDFLLTRFKNPLSAGGQGRGWQKNARFSSGIVFRFGGRHAPPPPSAPMSATCSADKESVYAGSADFVVVRVQAANPDENSLTYSWSASEGAVDGTGPEVRWNSSNRQPGTYTIKVRVDSGASATAGCSVNIRVEPRPNRPPTVSCSADRGAVTVGEPVEITAAASDPDNDPLSFSWNASGGNIEGSGPSVKFQTAGLTPGPYTITGRADDGRSGTADCSVNVDVQAAEPPPEVKELETRLTLRSIYFATDRPTAAHPAGGLAESQQKVLLALANDFNRYLTFKPQAHLILEAHADRRGSAEYNNQLTERRVERTKNFLVGCGVPAANVDTQSLGSEENLDTRQVKQLIEQNPGLSNDQRQKIESNLQVIVWANNRRVDISLNTTGQQSVRQYPFNAKDALTLLSAKDRKHKKRTTTPAPKKTTKH